MASPCRRDDHGLLGHCLAFDAGVVDWIRHGLHPDEGDIDMLEAMTVYKEVGYAGPFVSDHTPRVEGDTVWGHIGRSFSHGYMRGLVHAVNALSQKG